MNQKNLILIGGGGHCKSVIDVAESAGYNILGILDMPEEVGKSVLNYKVIGTDDDIPKYVDKAEFIITVGFIKNPAIRIRIYNRIKEVGGKLATIFASTAHVSRYATIGEGTVVMHQAVVNAGVQIGVNCIINTFTNIEHDAVVGDQCHISTGTMVNGDSRRNCHSLEPFAIGKGINANACYGIGNRYICEAFTTRKSIVIYFCTSGYYYVFKA